MQKLHRNPLGRLELGTDGVLRSVNLESEVIDAVGLPPRLIKALLDLSPYNEEREVRFRNSDGTLIPQEQWLAPDASILPRRFTTEQKDEIRRHYEENKDIIEENMRKRANGEIQGCGVVIQSNYRI
ncbi:uncharacterized protein N7503_000067 [Penicillium pulvis]|uniref:uncharacterized protein n=1 Tax=Penicillium pulvis TaxID=1562058 RepID=UPI0025474182|nr:uncharacterized protein N7503_000067 [Penicillium pulvis]KAJ5813317.1 hypothetical protein N7503_000067 [Penicillium pulvis]